MPATRSLVLLVAACVFAIACAADDAPVPVAGKVALILGASSGIGEQSAWILTKAGVKVVLAARRMERLSELADELKKAGGDAAAVKCDVSSAESMEAAFAFAEATYGGVDLVFSNAAIEGGVMVGPHETLDPAQMKLVADINVVGSGYYALKYAVPALRKRGGGVLAFTSSIVAAFSEHFYRIARAGYGEIASSFLVYSSTKSALDHIIRAAAGLYGDEGIRVYGINLGVFDSEMQDRTGGSSQNSGLNPYFKSSGGHGRDVGKLLLTFMDNTTAWAPGAQLVLDNDATFSLEVLHDTMFKPGPPEAMGWPAPADIKPHLRDLTGSRPYAFSESKEEL